MSTRAERQNEQSKDLIKARLDGFDPDNCRAYRLLCERLQLGTKKLPVRVILPIAEVIAKISGEVLEREALRHRGYLIWWCEHHYAHLERSLPHMKFHFSNGETTREWPPSA